MQPVHAILQTAADLEAAQQHLRLCLAHMADVPDPGPLRNDALEAIRMAITEVEHHMACLRDDIGFSLADDIALTEAMERAC